MKLSPRKAQTEPLPVDETTTFPKLLAELDRRYGDSRIAVQEKRYGIWQPSGWHELHTRVRDFAHGLASLGVQPGQVVAVLGDNRPEWLISELAAQSLGACTVGIYPTSVGEEVVHVLTDGQVRVVVVEDQEQVDKLIELKDRLPAVEKVIYYDTRGLEMYEVPYLVEFTAVEAAGREWGEAHPGWLDEQIAAGRAADVAVICTTSGTTGRPKLAMLSHANLLEMGRSMTELDPIGIGDRYLSFLPLAWIGEQMIAVACGLQRGFTLSFAEEAATQRADLRELGPNVMFSPPRIWEDMLSSIMVRVGEAGFAKRKTFGWGQAVGDRYADTRLKGAKAGLWLRLQHRLADWVALRPVREQLGLTRIDRCYTGGAPLGPDVFRFFHSIGVNLKQIYGQTEICGIAVMHTDDDIKFATVGKPCPGTDIRIAENGEILLKSKAVFHGYYGNEAATAEAIDADGWLHTGDAGYLDEHGHLVVIDRAKDVMEMPDGTRFSPAFIENKLKFSPYVEEAVVFWQDGQADITAILTIEPSTVGAWAEHRRLGYTTYTDLAGKPEVRELLSEEVARANEDLPESVRVRRFVLLHKQFDADDDEITRTRKVRRRVINDRYAAIIEALVDGDSQVQIKSLVTYQDGTNVTRDITLQIVNMDGFTPKAGARRTLFGSHA
ncbi:MAG: long-chain acyl-CoA synthetase [Actinomycetota bacterium]|nr:long-chain acyl-CoA synthetase [Actinomycetota bacterium]MDQ1499017.1 long-chain acyl-CoA synthetase [Actinomycetota bacterium]